jgi:hypothetical protein
MSVESIVVFGLCEVRSERGNTRNTNMSEFELGRPFTLSMCFVESDETRRHKEVDRRSRDESLYVEDSLNVPE